MLTMTFLLQTFITEYAWHFISVKLKISSFIYHQMQLWNTEFLTIRSRCLFEMFPSFAIWKVICISTWFFNYKFFFIGLWLLWAPLVAQRIKNLTLTQETWVQSLGGENPLEKGMVTHSSVLAWRILWTEEPGRLHSMVSQRIGHDWVTNTQTHMIA